MNFKTPLLAACLAVFATPHLAADGPGTLPDIPGFRTLHCDFHIHTVFSDGKVWPDMRVLEAAREGLDCIAITDHFKYKIDSVRKKHPEIQGDRNRAYEIARDAAQDSGVIVIRGAEVTQGMPPGHINAIFLSDANIAKPDLTDTMRIARDQGAFLFWNHPSWKSPDKKWEQDAIAQWFDIHTELLEADILNGIEVVNGFTYSREAHQWALDKNLTIFANTDIHIPMGLEYDLTEQHRPTTLVFAEEKTEAAIRDALFDRRTAVWFGNSLIGSADYLAPLFEACIDQEPAAYLENLAVVMLKNVCGMDFHVENNSPFDFYNKTRFFSIAAGESVGLAIKTGQRMEEIGLDLSVRNLHTTPDEALSTRLSLEVTGEITDKKLLDQLYSD